MTLGRILMFHSFGCLHITGQIAVKDVPWSCWAIPGSACNSDMVEAATDRTYAGTVLLMNPPNAKIPRARQPDTFRMRSCHTKPGNHQRLSTRPGEPLVEVTLAYATGGSCRRRAVTVVKRKH